MNYISELAYANHIMQTTKSAKDRKQKNKYQLSELLDEEFIDQGTAALITHINHNLWQGEERRCGDDRRQTELDRGRYLESRQSKDRRYSAKLDIKI